MQVPRALITDTTRARRVKLDLSGFDAPPQRATRPAQRVANAQLAAKPSVAQSVAPAPTASLTLRKSLVRFAPDAQNPPPQDITLDKNPKDSPLLEGSKKVKPEPKTHNRGFFENRFSGDGVSNAILISTAANAAFLVLFTLIIGIFILSQPRAINVINSPMPNAQMDYGVGYETYAQYRQPPVNAMSVNLRRDALSQSVREIMDEPEDVAQQQFVPPRDDGAVIEFLASELVQSTSDAKVSDAEKVKKQAVLQQQYSAREIARKKLKAVYEAEIARLESLHARGLIDRNTVEKVKKEALRQDVELRDSLIVAMASSDGVPTLMPESPVAQFKAPHAHDFVAKVPKALPRQVAHPSQN